MSKTLKDKNGTTLATVLESTDIVANPTPSGTPTELNLLEIKGTQYKAANDSALYLIGVYSYNAGYPSYCTLFVNRANLSTFDDLYNYLVNKGCVFDATNTRYIMYPCAGVDESGDNYKFVGLSTSIENEGDENEVRRIQGVTNDNYQYGIDDATGADSENFSITYLSRIL